MKAITCPSPVVPNTQVIHLNDSVGGSVTLSCVAGFDHVGGNLERTCLDTGTWSGVSPICTGTMLFKEYTYKYWGITRVRGGSIFVEFVGTPHQRIKN